MAWLWLAHLIGDFPLQTDGMMARKMSSMGGVISHALMVSAVILLALVLISQMGSGPYISSGHIGLIVLLVLLSHTAQDHFKIQWDKNKGKGQGLTSFFIDQWIHLGLLALFAWMIKPDFFASMPNRWVWIAISLLTAVYLAGIAIQIKLNQVHPLENRRFFGDREKGQGLLIRAFSWLFGFAGGYMPELLPAWIGVGVWWQKQWAGR